MGSHPLRHKVLLPQLKMIVLILMALLTCGGGQQIPPQDRHTLILMTVIDTLDSLSLQLKEFQVKVEAKFEEVQANVTEILVSQETIERKLEEQRVEFQQCAQRDHLNTILTGQQQLGNDIKEEISEFKVLLPKDECMDGSHACSQMATCTDSFYQYRCACFPGYSGDGFNCEDVDECHDGTSSCGSTQDCTNIPGGYNCSCQLGYRQQGNICQDIDECSEKSDTCGASEWCLNNPGSYICHECVSPSLYLEELGCISLIDERMAWNAAKSKCEEEDKRLLEGILHKHLEPLRKHFYPYIPDKTWSLGYVGMQHSRWITSGEEVTDEDLWYPGQPSGSGNTDTCGFVYLHPSFLGLADTTCSFHNYALCQSLPY